MFFLKNKKREIERIRILKSKQTIYLENLKKKQNEEKLALKEKIEKEKKK